MDKVALNAVPLFTWNSSARGGKYRADWGAAGIPSGGRMKILKLFRSCLCTLVMERALALNAYCLIIKTFISLQCWAMRVSTLINSDTL